MKIRRLKNGRKPIIGLDSKRVGVSVEYYMRSVYPLDDDKIDQILDTAVKDIRREKKKGQWFFVALRLKVLGGLYQTTFAVPEDEEDMPWEEQWVSTKVVRTVKELRSDFRDLLDNVVDFHLQHRPARVIGFKVTTFHPRKK